MENRVFHVRQAVLNSSSFPIKMNFRDYLKIQSKNKETDWKKMALGPIVMTLNENDQNRKVCEISLSFSDGESSE